MGYLIIAISVLLMAIVIMMTEKEKHGVTIVAFALLRILSIALFVTSFAIAFDIVEIPSDYYGFVKLQHQLTYAVIFGLGSVTLAILSVYRR